MRNVSLVKVGLSAGALAVAACSRAPGPDSPPAASGGAAPAGGASPSGGAEAASGGSSSGEAGGTTSAGGTPATGSGGEAPAGGSAGSGGAASTGGSAASGGAGSGGADGTGGEFAGTCTPSESAGESAAGSGPHEVVVETNSDPGINEGTIFRPADLGGNEKYPILVWGQGACSQDGLANAAAMTEIASHGYFVVADGTPGGAGSRPMDKTNLAAMGAPLIAYLDWAIAENEKPCSAYYQGLEVTKVASNGFSCGGLMAQGTVSDPRIVTWGVTSSGMADIPEAFYDDVHTPVLFIEGGPAEVAYDGGKEGYERISQLGVPVLWFSKDLGHGGDLFTQGGGDFTRIHLAWLNWWLKADETATGKGLLVGAGCSYCQDAEWEVFSADIP